MFGSQILDIGIGLIFVYLLLGLIFSVLNEWIARIFALRSGNLEDGIRNLLSGKSSEGRELADIFYEHPLVKGLSRQEWFDKLLGRLGRPSYIPSRTFALALLDILAPAAVAGPKAFEDVRKAVAELPDSDVKKVLLFHLDESGGKLEMARANVEQWFNDSMDRVSGWYKRRLQLITLTVALVASVWLNADTFAIATGLYRDATLRASVVAAAQETVKQPLPGGAQPSLTKIEQIQGELQQIRLPMGWADPSQIPHNPWEWICKILGWLFTAFAASLGAPFWFDVLSRFVDLRSDGKRPEKKPG
jgi:hypothetical protein